MKEIPTKWVRCALHHYRFARCSFGCGGHEIWRDDCGRTCKPVFRKSTMNMAALYSLGNELEVKGVCSRKAFIDEVLYANRKDVLRRTHKTCGTGDKPSSVPTTSCNGKEVI